MGLKLDFTDVQGGFATVPAGTYSAVVYEIEQKTAQNGNPYLNWQFKIMGGDNDGRIVFDITSLQPQALWKLKSTLKALDPDMDLNGMCDLDTDELLGKECTITIAHEMYNNEPQARVKKVAPASNASSSDDLPDFMK